MNTPISNPAGISPAVTPHAPNHTGDQTDGVPVRGLSQGSDVAHPGARTGDIAKPTVFQCIDGQRTRADELRSSQRTPVSHAGADGNNASKASVSEHCARIGGDLNELLAFDLSEVGRIALECVGRRCVELKQELKELEVSCLTSPGLDANLTQVQGLFDLAGDLLEKVSDDPDSDPNPSVMEPLSLSNPGNVVGSSPR